MIGYISGKVMDIGTGKLLIENNGIGYEVTVSAAAFARLTKNMQGGVYTFFNARQDQSSIVYTLYGFDSKEEKEMYLKLTSVKDVGAKIGMTILATLSLKDLALAIAASDAKTLASVKGVGRKTAERIILELREKVSSLDLGELPSVPVARGADEDAVIALMSLGFGRGESEKGVSAARSQGADDLEDIISLALKNLAK